MTDAAAPAQFEVSPGRMRLVIAASAAGTAFEWYDFFVYGSLAAAMAPHFLAGLPDAQAFIFILLTFAVGFIVRPLGALVFGKVGDSLGRKGAFLTTISIMGLATFAIGLLPTADKVGLWAPALLIACRILQGFALGGEYGGAAIYVAEHAPHHRRGQSTGWVQSSASIGLIGALAIILIARAQMSEADFNEWGWRVPFLVSIGLLAISVWIRMQLEESPAFQKIKAEGKVTQRAYAESFLRWPNLKLVLLTLFGLMTAQGVVWYTAHFYSQFFLQRILHVDSITVYLVMITIVIISAPLYMLFARLSDTIGRKPVMLGGILLMLALYFPGFHLLTQTVNPQLAEATKTAPVVVLADPADCSFQLDIIGAAQFTSSCDMAKSALANAGVAYTTEAAHSGATARVRIGDQHEVDSVDATSMTTSEIGAARKAFQASLDQALGAAGYPHAATQFSFDGKSLADLPGFYLRHWAPFLILILFVVAATALYGPQAAALVELFPTRIRYTALSFPYHLGIGWFGGLLPATVFAINTATGDPYAGLWFPAVVTAFAAIVTFLFWPETKDRDIHAD